METAHYTVPTAKVKACSFKLCNVYFILGRGLREIVNLIVLVANMTRWLLELHSVQLDPSWNVHCTIPGANLVA